MYRKRLPFFDEEFERITEYEYFKTQPSTTPKRFNDASAFAFFVVHFGYSREEYNQLTDAEKRLIIKMHESYTVEQSTLIQHACEIAIANAYPKKHKTKAKKLWKRLPKKIGEDEKNEYKQQLDIVQEMENNDDKSWIDKIYSANGYYRR